jgi:hypothetical protein
MSYMLETQLTGPSKNASGIQGRMFSIDEGNAQKLRTDVLLEKGNEFRDAAKAGSEIPKHMYALIGDAKKSFSDLKESAGRTIAKAYADDYDHFAKVVQARTDGRYLEYTQANGTRERGIVAEVNGEKAREGMWIARDDQGRLRQLGSFREGKPHGSFRDFREDGSMESSKYFENGAQKGTAYKYDEKSRVIHKETWENGQKMKEEAVDPEKAAASRAINAMRIGR